MSGFGVSMLGIKYICSGSTKYVRDLVSMIGIVRVSNVGIW